MSETHLPNPVSEDPPAEAEAASSPNPDDPLLERGSYIDPPQNNLTESQQPAEQPAVNPEQPAGNPQFPPGVVIAAEPISMYLPGENSPDPPPSARRRNREEMSKRPSWLPEDWTIDLRVRSSGATAGLIDRYYVEPTGQRRFRSKNEVLHFLETGIKLKRRATSETDAGQSGSSASQKEKKSSAKRKKPDIAAPAHANGVRADT